ncbi:MAG: VWA domain-containing protein [Pyrinomonadaceae bacterium]|nr:VWA domain-containing protein [Pyrinomonadaceae bacterium]
MRSRRIFALVCSMFTILIAAGAVSAQGVVIPIVCDFRPCQPRPPRPLPQPLPNALPVKSIKIDVKIENQVSTTHVEQIFRNDTPYTLEGTYFFPIPETASVVEFAIWENGKKLVGEVRSREEARRIYDEIVRRQKDPGLLEYAGKDLFQASIFPIPPNSDKKLELTYTEILKADSGTVAYRYPLGTGRNVWANRSGPYREMNSSSRIPDRNQKFGTVSGKIEIQGTVALRNIYSPSHSIETDYSGEKKAIISFETNSNDNDFQLFYGISNNDFGMSLITFREPGKDGYFLMMLSPRDSVTDREIVNKDIVFVLDTSGSMADAGKIEKARAALIFGIRGLNEGDRFNVINFAGEEHLMEEGLIKADRSGTAKGIAFVEKLKPTGGTNINDALRAGLKQFDASDRPKMLVFMTDGLPTVGEADVDRIIENAKQIKVENLRIFPFGVGYDVNTRLLDKLATANAGLAEYVEPKENLEIKVSNFFTRVNSPVLTDLEINFGAVAVDLMYPRKLTDVFKGTQLVVLGRYTNADDLKNVTLKLSGKSGKETRTFDYHNLDFPRRSSENDFLPRLWASRRVGWLLEQIRTNGENKELKDEIVELGTKYGLVTPYTSYLATDGSIQNLFSIDGQSVTPPGKPAFAGAIVQESGRDAVKMSRQQNTMQSNVNVYRADAEDKSEQIFVDRSISNQFVGTKNFNNINGTWIDTDYNMPQEFPVVRIEFASQEYFDLIAAEPELAKYFSLGEQVIVVWKGKVYKIVKS